MEFEGNFLIPRDAATLQIFIPSHVLVCQCDSEYNINNSLHPPKTQLDLA